MESRNHPRLPINNIPTLLLVVFVCVLFGFYTIVTTYQPNVTILSQTERIHERRYNTTTTTTIPPNDEVDDAIVLFDEQQQQQQQPKQQQQQQPIDSTKKITTTTPTTAGPAVVTTSTTTTTTTTFVERVRNFPFEELVNNNTDIATEYWIELATIAYDITILEPPVPINTTCLPPKVRIQSNDCSQNPDLFTGELNPHPIKIAHAIQFGFDADVLEIHFNELYDVVDKIFLIESIMAHNGGLGGSNNGGNSATVNRTAVTTQKPLTWENIKRQTRFHRVRDKVIHLIMDDVDTERIKYHPLQQRADIFTAEKYQEYMRWQKIMDWNAVTGYFNDTDLIGFGDTDEITSRYNLYKLKYCQLVPTFHAVDIGIWFPLGNLNTAYASDFPVAAERYTLGDPTFRTFGTTKTLVMDYTTLVAPSRARGNSGVALIGGIHLSWYGPLAYMLSKLLSCTECFVGSKQLNDLASKLITTAASATSTSSSLSLSPYYNTSKWIELEYNIHMQWITILQNRYQYLDELDPATRNKVVHYPWYYLCNKERYPVFIGQPDPRTVPIKYSKK